MPRLKSLIQRIGIFVVLHILAAAIIIFMMLLFGINPTLVISVVAAPIWIGLAILNYWFSGIFQKVYF